MMINCGGISPNQFSRPLPTTAFVSGQKAQKKQSTGEQKVPLFGVGI
jgi:hypothetical protein